MQHSGNRSQGSTSQHPLVLAVDDDEDNLLLLTYSLALFGYSSISTADGETALLLVRNYRPDLILLDIVLPGLTGVDVVQRLKQDLQTTTIPVIAVTSLAGAADREQLLQAGCSDYISKPYSLENLEGMIERHLIAAPVTV